MWNAHDNYLILGTPEQLEEAVEQIAVKWVSAASAARVQASTASQYVEHARATGGVRHYILKRLMGRSSPHSPGQTPGDLYAAMTYQGDADAAEAWEELEAFFRRRVPGNLSSRSGSFYDRGVTHRAQVALAA